MNNAIDDRYVVNEQTETIANQEKQPKLSHNIPENSLRHSPNGKNKRLLTKDIMSGKFLLMKSNLHLSISSFQKLNILSNIYISHVEQIMMLHQHFY
jgi:hypothetical protein